MVITKVQKWNYKTNIWGWHSPKGDHSNCKRKAKPSSRGVGKVVLWSENNGKKFRKYEQVESIAVYLQNMPTYYIKYGKEVDRIKTLIGLIHEGVARMVATEERCSNVSKSIMMEQCFKDE